MDAAVLSNDAKKTESYNGIITCQLLPAVLPVHLFKAHALSLDRERGDPEWKTADKLPHSTKYESEKEEDQEMIGEVAAIAVVAPSIVHLRGPRYQRRKDDILKSTTQAHRR